MSAYMVTLGLCSAQFHQIASRSLKSTCTIIETVFHEIQYEFATEIRVRNDAISLIT